MGRRLTATSTLCSVPLITRDEESEAFFDHDLSGLDCAQFRPMGLRGDAGLPLAGGAGYGRRQTGPMPAALKDMLDAAHAAVPKVGREEVEALTAEGALVVDVRDSAGQAQGGRWPGRGLACAGGWSFGRVGRGAGSSDRVCGMVRGQVRGG